MYVKNGYYHLYNRGVNKAPIFFEESDYKMFLFLIKLYLSNPSTSKKLILENSTKHLYFPKNFYTKLSIVAFVLMPNHFHLLVHQTEARTIEGFMRALNIKYAMYCKKKYDRTGHLFQGSYKGVLIEHDNYLLQVSRYIHRNPDDLDYRKLVFSKTWDSYKNYPFSSYSWYVQCKKLEWFDPTPIMQFYALTQQSKPTERRSYEYFVKNYRKSSHKSLKRILLDS